MATAIIIGPSSETPDKQRNWPARLMNIMREGVAAGTLSGAAVALWYLACDTLGGRPLATPALLGSIFFRTLPGHFLGGSMLAPILAFTALHFAAFIVFGLATAAIVAAAEREPMLLLGALMGYACYEVCFLAFVAILDGTALGAIGWWKIAAANIVTLVLVFSYFKHHHPQVLARFCLRWDRFDAKPTAEAVRANMPHISHQV